MWYGYENSIDIGIFPGVQMMYPAAGVMAAYWATRRGDKRFPAKFYKTFLIITGLMIIIAVGSVVFPAGVWNTVNSLLLIGGSAVCWMMMLLEESWESREAYGMKNRNTKASVFCVLLFIVLYLGRILVVDLKGGSLKEVLIMLLSPRSVISVFTIGFSFFVSFILFLGEEYGWRYFLQPMLQKRFGTIKGVILLGVVWGLWHFPINLFYYSAPGFALFSVAGQQITCISLGIFLAYAYMKTNNIWVPVILHYINNNMIVLFSGGESVNIEGSQMGSWKDLLLVLVLNLVFYCSVLFTKTFRKHQQE